MKYPVAIEMGEDSAWSAIVPDFPGCFSAADDGLEELIKQCKEAMHLWVEHAIESGESIPSPSSIQEQSLNKEFDGYSWIEIELVL